MKNWLTLPLLMLLSACKTPVSIEFNQPVPEQRQIFGEVTRKIFPYNSCWQQAVEYARKSNQAGYNVYVVAIPGDHAFNFEEIDGRILFTDVTQNVYRSPHYYRNYKKSLKEYGISFHEQIDCENK